MKTVTVNPKNCVGCRNCEMSCAFMQSQDSCDRINSNIKVNISVADKFVLPITCLHCEEAWCLHVCPASAISRDPETNAVVIDKNRCAGCKMCILACPYGNIHFDHVNLVSHKCDLCGGDPECVKHCIGEALQYEDIDEVIAGKRASLDKKLQELMKEII